LNLSGFISGIVLGVSIAAPVGALGLLCINRILQRGLERDDFG
jgi:arginine exporter protein ArgO